MSPTDAETETETDTETAIPPSQRKALHVLTGLGLLSALWALFLWYQLLRARSGFDPFCAFGGTDCGRLWDADFASWVHGRTGLPVAAWGVVWSVVAASLPLRVLGLASGGSAQSIANGIGAIRWTGLAGVLGVVGLLMASAAESLFCSSCALTYVFTLGYAATVFFGLRGTPARLDFPTLKPALIAGGLAWAVLLLPGLKTPESPFRQAQEALGIDGEATSGNEAAAGEGNSAATSRDDSLADHPLKVPTWPLEPAEQERRLRDFVGQMEPNLRQYFSDYLNAFRSAEPGPDPMPRNLHGPQDAATRLTEFTETRCGHCAELFVNLKAFAQLFPPAALAVDSRHFPLDGHCNPGFQIRDTDRTSCVAAKARICMEGREGLLAYEELLYRNQQELDEDRVIELAGPYMTADALKLCIDDARTDAKLQDDIGFAEHYEPQGTPLVLINGRQFTPIAPFLYALTLAGGNADHPAFADLPAPRPLPEDDHGHLH